MKHIIIILSLLFMPLALYSQDVKVSAKIDSIAIEIGDQTWLNLSAEQDKNQIVNFPMLKDTIIRGIDIIQVEPIDTQYVNNRVIATQRILITAFDDSIFSIPPFVFTNKKDTLLTNSLILSVQNVAIDSALVAKIDTSQMLDIFDIEQPINTPFTFKEFWSRFAWIIFTIIGVAVAIIIIVILVKRARSNKPIIAKPPKPKEPAHIIAIRNLDKLKSQKVWQSGKEKLYYSKLTDILKEYIENRYMVSTFELTSLELLDMVKNMKLFDDENNSKLKQILSIADLAKFAKFKPLPAENDLSMNYAYQIVENTKAIKVSDNETDTKKVEQAENEELKN